MAINQNWLGLVTYWLSGSWIHFKCWEKTDYEELVPTVKIDYRKETRQNEHILYPENSNRKSSFDDPDSTNEISIKVYPKLLSLNRYLPENPQN